MDCGRAGDHAAGGGVGFAESPVNHARTMWVFRTGSIGDWMVCLPALYAIRRRWPAARLVLLTHKARPGSPHVTEILPRGSVYDGVLYYRSHPLLLPAELLRLRLRARPSPKDVLFYMRGYGSPPARRRRDRLALGLAGFRCVISHQTGAGAAAGRPEVPEWRWLLDIVRRAGARLGLPRRLYPVRASDLARVRRMLPPRGQMPRLAVCPASKMPAKVWPQDRTAEIVRRLVNRGCQVVFVGSGRDRPFIQDLLAEVGPDGSDLCVNLAGSTSVAESAAVISTCDLYFGMDTGPMHLAAVLGLPCVAVFSARDFGNRWRPYGDGHELLVADVECGGCRREVCPRKGHPCMNAITVERVWESVRARVQPRDNPRGPRREVL